MFESSNNVTSFGEHRAHPWLRVDSLVPIDPGKGTSGTVLNIAEGELAAASSGCADRVFSDFSPPFPTANITPVDGQLAWMSNSRTEVGIKLIDLQEETRNKIRDWISLESSQRTVQRESNASAD